MWKWFRWVLLTLSILIVCFFVAAFLYSRNRQNPIFIEYRQGPVSLKGFSYLDTSKSSFVRGAWYKFSDEYLVIKLNDKYYHYCKFPENIWVEFNKVDSFGTFYNSNIKDKYPCGEDIQLYPGDICAEKMFIESRKYLQALGYHEVDDGSWRDSKGDLPDENFDEYAHEEYMSKIWLDCIDSY